MNLTPEFEEEKQEYQSVLASGIFNRAPNLAQLLTYVCERYFEGAAEQIKEYNIAVEALGRPAGFDQKRDSIVRVEAHRLRKRLREYYEGDGAARRVRIEIPPGQYAPVFVRCAPGQSNAAGDLAVSSPAPRQEWTGAATLAPIQSPVPFNVPAPLLVARVPLSHARIWLAGFVAVLALSGAAIWKTSAAKPRTLPADPIGVIAPAPSQGIRILTGLKDGVYTDRAGRVWQSDRYYDGGSVFEFTGQPIAGARDQRLFVSRREGAFSYDIPLPPGVYEMRLYFAETLYGENNLAGGGETSRIFNVTANSVPILRDFDVIREAGPTAADIRAFKDIVPAADGKLHLKFNPMTNPAIVSAIEITPGTRGHLLPVRIASRDHPYTDKQGRTWMPDSYSRGGQLAMRKEPVANIEDPELLHGERFGNITLVIPAPPGRYAVNLYFAEAWFGPSKFAGGGVGSRIFDILCNGVAVRRGFDIFKEAHGSDRAVVLPIHGLEPESQGKLTISLMPVRNYAAINAVEVIDESN